ncbi:MAG TPA: NAD-dependent epimerase/dehydratase family protein [Chthoniobacteraceae bacterium]|jgi:UDP-glucose 4-epimerase|nr:NAD-dependent epimerase/dehydratase family protein [Chthoniobacteraceae bacterium]
MRILITGGAGFIGSHVTEYYQGRAEVRVLDNFRSGYPHNLKGMDAELIEGDICDPATVRRAINGVDVVYHLAALVSVPESVSKPEECRRINIEGYLNVLEAAAAGGVRKVLFASSAAIYGNNPTVPKVETMKPEPLSPYAATKLEGELHADTFRRERGLPTACLRFFNVFGPRQDPRSAYAAAVPIFMEKALRNEPLTIYGDGGQTRDFIYVKDIVGALVYLAGHPDLGGVYNAGYGGSITISQLASTIIRLADSKSEIRHAPGRAGDVRHSRASVEKLLGTGWLPAFTVEDGLDTTLAALRATHAR